MLLLLVGKFEMLAKDGHPTPKIELNLLVGGVIIIGDLISSVEFEKESHNATKLLFKIHDDAAAETARMCHTTQAEVVGPIPEFLHLRNVEFWPYNLTNTADALSSELWRLRISSIDAFQINNSKE